MCSVETMFSLAANRKYVKWVICANTPAKTVFVFSLFLTLINTEGERVVIMTRKNKEETWSMVLNIWPVCSCVVGDTSGRLIRKVKQSNAKIKALRGHGRVASILALF